jgi:tripartite-type tricarboxylate transporter receptor subunit TctC
MPNFPKQNRRQLIISGLAGTTVSMFGVSGSVSSLAQTKVSWPSQPTRIIVPVPAGGQTDVFARFVADHLSKTFGQPFIIENRPGAVGKIALQNLLSSPADGHTLLFSAASFVVVPQALNLFSPIDVIRDLAPIAQIGAGGNFLAVSNEIPVQNIKELLAYIRANKTPLSYGSHGIGSVTHILMSSLISSQGLQMNHVPYKSGAEVLRDMMGGVLPIGWVDTTNGAQAARTGRIRLLGVSGTFRVPGNPEILTIAEQGFGLNQNGWLGLFAAANTPATILRAINTEVMRLMSSDQARQRLITMNIAVFPYNAPEQFAETIRSDVSAWRKIVSDNQIKLE